METILYKVRARINDSEWVLAATFDKCHADQILHYWSRKYPDIWVEECRYE